MPSSGSREGGYMAVGSQPPANKADFNEFVGNIAKDWERICQRVIEAQEFMARTPDANLKLVPYEYVQPELDIIHSAFGDLMACVNDYKANHRAFVQQLLGTGAHN